jgi:hypothetical protein
VESKARETYLSLLEGIQRQRNEKNEEMAKLGTEVISALFESQPYATFNRANVDFEDFTLDLSMTFPADKASILDESDLFESNVIHFCGMTIKHGLVTIELIVYLDRQL